MALSETKRKRSTFRIIFDLILLVLLVLAICVYILDQYNRKKNSKIEGNEAFIESNSNQPYIYQGEYDLGSVKNPDGILKIKGQNTSVVMDGEHRFSWLSIEGGATIKQKKQEDGGNGLTLRVIYTMRIDENSKIDLNSAGYPATKAVNSSLAGQNSSDLSSGGGGGASVVFIGEAPTKGGEGQGPTSGAGGFYNPESGSPQFSYPGFFGSGGGSAEYQEKLTGGHGGGLLSIFAGKFTNFGKILLNGEDGKTPDKNEAGNGGGSGGSFYARIGQFENFGEISVSGGKGSVAEKNISGGGGSGGTIIVYFWEAGNQGKVLVSGGEPGGSDGAKLLTRGGGDLGIKQIEAIKQINFDQPPFNEANEKPLIYPYLISQKAPNIISSNKIEGDLTKKRVTLVFAISGDDYIGNDPEEPDAFLKIKFSAPISVEDLNDCSYVDERCFLMPATDFYRKVDENGNAITKERSDIVMINQKQFDEINWQIYDLEPGMISYYWLSINLKKFNQPNLSIRAQLESTKDPKTGKTREELDVVSNLMEKTWAIR